MIAASQHRSSLRGLLFLLLGLGALTVALLGGSRAAYLGVKATTAQWLLDRAWEHSLLSQSPARPWNWADTKAAARLSITLNEGSKSKSLIVLDNASGEAMAFGPGLVAGKLAEVATQTIAIGGHRDTHLAFLEQANQQTRFELQVPDGRRIHYRFDNAFVVDSRHQALQISVDQPGLVLITCYPFNALQTGGPLRLIVRAHRVAP